MQKLQTAKKNLARDAELMELFYAGDKIRISVLARQMKMDKAQVRTILQRYFPLQSDRNVAMLISSKINDMIGQGEYQLKQEDQED